MSNEKPTYYTVLPALVRYDEELSPYARLLYGDIVFLAQKNGYCFAGNTIFANYYGVDKKSVSKWIGDLIKRGSLRREVIRDSNNRIVERRLYIEDLPINPTMDTLSIHEGIPSPSVDGDPIHPTTEDNNTSVNNTSINNIVGQEKNEEPKERIPYKKIIDYLNEKTGKKYSSSAKKNQDLIKARWNEGFRLDDFERVVDNMVINWNGQLFNGAPAEQYLRPSTLFGNKFDNYLNQVPKQQVIPFNNESSNIYEHKVTDEDIAEFERLKKGE